MFKRANEWLSHRLAENRERKQGKISVTAAGLQIAHDKDSQLVPWADVTAVEAILKDAYLGDNLGLVIRFANGRDLTVLEYDPSWAELSQSIHRYLPGSVPYPEWSLRTAFTEPSRKFQVYRKSLA